MKMKTRNKIGTQIRMGCAIALIAIITLAIIGCKDEPETNDDNVVKERSTTINTLEGKTATVKGEFDKAGLNSAAGKIETAIREAINGIPDDMADAVKNGIKDQYRKCEFIIVENSPTYANWKTNGDGKTIFLNFTVLDSADLWNLINSATASMKLNGSTTAKVIDNSNAVRIAIQPKQVTLNV